MAEQGQAFEDGLVGIGFRLAGSSRRGGRMWELTFNRYLEFVLHDFHEHVVLTWALKLGEYMEEHGFQLGSGESSYHELYPARDVRLPIDADAVRAEISRVLGSLRFDFADPTL